MKTNFESPKNIFADQKFDKPSTNWRNIPLEEEFLTPEPSKLNVTKKLSLERCAEFNLNTNRSVLERKNVSAADVKTITEPPTKSNHIIKSFSDKECKARKNLKNPKKSWPNDKHLHVSVTLHSSSITDSKPLVAPLAAADAESIVNRIRNNQKCYVQTKPNTLQTKRQNIEPSTRGRMLPRIKSSPIIETESKINIKKGKCHENYLNRTLRTSHTQLIAQSSTVSSKNSEIDSLLHTETNFKSPIFNVYTVPNIEPLLNNKRPTATNNKQIDDLDFTFFFPTLQAESIKDKLRASSSDSFDQRLTQVKLLAREKKKKQDEKRLHEERNRKEAEAIKRIEKEFKLKSQKKKTKKVQSAKPKIKKIDTEVIEKKGKITMRFDKRKLIENESVEGHMKLQVPPSAVPQKFEKELQKITDLIAEGSDKLYREDKNILDSFIDKVDNIAKIKTKSVKKKLSFPVPQPSVEKIKLDLAKVTDLVEDGIECLSDTEVKTVNKFLNKLDKVESKRKEKKVKVPLTQEIGISLRANLQRVTELTTKALNTLSEKQKEEINKFIDKVDATDMYVETKREKTEEVIKLNQRQQLSALTLAEEFRKSLKSITNILRTGTYKFNEKDKEMFEKFVKKLDDIEGAKKRLKNQALAKFEEMLSLRLRRKKSSPTLSPERSAIDETKKTLKDENIFTVKPEDTEMLKQSDLVEIRKTENDNLVSPRNIRDDVYNEQDIPRIFQEPGNDIIFGNEIVPKQYVSKRVSSQNILKPFLFQSIFTDISEPQKKMVPEFETTKLTVSMKLPETKGVFRYALSDRTFIDKGYTVLPTKLTLRKLKIYDMRPAKPEFDWFKRNRQKELILYDTGEQLAKFQENGKCVWYYRNGRIALEYYKPQEHNARKRYVIYSTGEPDDRGKYRPYTVLAMFDYLGNGLVYDHTGKIRIKYNQTEGVVLDKSTGPIIHWKWHNLNDPPILQHIMIENYLTHKDPEILKYKDGDHHKEISEIEQSNIERMLEIELENYAKEHLNRSKKTPTFRPFQIRMKALKINEYFSLKILDQANIYLTFRDGKTNFKLDIGMILDHKNIIDTDVVHMEEIVSKVEKYPACTKSIGSLQRKIEQAQYIEQTFKDYQRRVQPPAPAPAASLDYLNRAISKPLHPLVRKLPVSENARLCK